MTVSRTLWQNIQHYSWLVLGLLCLLLALIFWAITSSDKVVQVEKQDIVETQSQIQPQKVTATTNLGTLSDEVRPLDLTMRVITAGNHEAEFRGTKFMQENQRNWTIELFRSSNENIIKNYLKSQSDRKNFIYFRLSGENQEEQYVLAYGVFNREADATHQLSQLNLKFPASVHPKAVSLANYLPLINDLGSEEIKGSAGQLYSVNLRNAPMPELCRYLLGFGEETHRCLLLLYHQLPPLSLHLLLQRPQQQSLSVIKTGMWSVCSANQIMFLLQIQVVLHLIPLMWKIVLRGTMNAK